MKKLLALLFLLLAAPVAAQVIPSGPVGSINYWGVGGLSTVLNPGLAGQCLETQGTGSAPVWVACPGSALNLLPPINTNQFYGNVSGQFAPPVGVDVNTILNTVGYDIARPPPVESILYKSNVGPAFNWQALPPSTAGSLLTSGGPTNPIFWAPNTIQANLTGICTTVGAVLYFDTPSNLWKCLAPGTAGQGLQTGGAGANPSWVTVVPTTRNINTSTPLGGGGALSADLTLSCATCATTTNGGPLTATAPLSISAAGVISIPNPLPVANGGTGGGTASGTLLDNITGFASTGILDRTGPGAYSFLTAPAGTIVGTTDTQTLTNKTIDTAGPNTLKVNGVTLSVGQYPGTATNDNATAGNEGEYFTSSVVAGSAVALTTATAANITSINTLPAGDWDVWIDATVTGATTTVCNGFEFSISTTSATLNTTNGQYTSGTGFGTSCFAAAQDPQDAISFVVGPVRMSLASATQVFFVAKATFTTSTMSAYGIIQARRRR